MRFMLLIVLLSLAGFLGWIAGSFHPAPRLILDPIEQFLANDLPDALLETDPTPTHSVWAPANPEVSPTETESVPPPEPLPKPEPEPAEETNQMEPQDQYRLWIREARTAHPYPESEDKMYAVMMCESGGRSDIINPAGPYSGLFQYSTDTWNGDWNQYRDRDILDARAQVFATALAWSENMQSQWGCYNRPH
ncbi:MAG: hypothetical protein AAFU69_00080 [Pseudomonadota bacterium]